MTITVAIKVGDGIVLASDSATTQTLTDSTGHSDTINVWNTANKIFNLRKQWPLGAMTWGLAAIDGRTIAEHMKDLRREFTDGAGSIPPLDQDYTVENVAQRVQAHFSGLLSNSAQRSFLGLLVAGYDGAFGAPGRAFEVTFDDAGNETCEELLPGGEPGLLQWGQPEAIARLVDGVSSYLVQALVNLGTDATSAPLYVEAIKSQIAQPIIHDGMPIAEVVDLAEFLVDTTIKYVRFTPGHPVVGGPIEVAAITRHEGFKWARRKHHYSSSLNPNSE